jgi:uncharacterized protein
MRVIIDTNVFISYLLRPGDAGAVRTVVHSAISAEYVVLMPASLLDEIIATVSANSRLVRKISRDELRELVDVLERVAEVIPAIAETIPQVTRDPKDDYLLAYAVVGRADYLVSGDQDLLTLGEVESLQILSPADFAKLLTK